MIGVFVSGVTAFPLPQEVALLARILGIQDKVAPETYTGIIGWIAHVHRGLDETAIRWPFLFYGTDWLAFGHIVIGLLFIGPFKDPVRNVWVIQWGILTCGLVIPLALICGPLRGIPFYWQCIDCIFGIVGAPVLMMALKLVRELEGVQTAIE